MRSIVFLLNLKENKEITIDVPGWRHHLRLPHTGAGGGEEEAEGGCQALSSHDRLFHFIVCKVVECLMRFTLWGHLFTCSRFSLCLGAVFGESGPGDQALEPQRGESVGPPKFRRVASSNEDCLHGQTFLPKEEDKVEFNSLWRAAVQWQPHSEKGPVFLRLLAYVLVTVPGRSPPRVDVHI